MLNNGFELIVSVQIDGISSGIESFLEVGLEGVHNQSDLQVGIRGEDLGGVHSSDFKGPGVDHNHLIVEVYNVDVGELLVELSDGFLGEVGGDEEEAISHEEMRVRFLDVAFQGFLEVLGDLGEVAALVEHLSEQLFERTLLSLAFAHDFRTMDIERKLVCLKY